MAVQGAKSSMSDVFVSYSIKDRNTVRELVALLKQQWAVWWDDVVVYDFDDVIEHEIANAKCLVVIWSTKSCRSRSVKDEVRRAWALDIPVVSIKLEPCTLPLGFGDLSCVNLEGWQGDASEERLGQVLRRISHVVPPAATVSRPDNLFGKRLSLPSLFLSVSSHETQLTPGLAVQALRIHQAPTILVSAYDAVGARRDEQMLEELALYRQAGGFVLVDSGNYEASRLRDLDWSPNQLAQALAVIPHDCIFSFDILSPSPDPDAAVDEIAASVARNRSFTSAPVLPILHAAGLEAGGFDTDVLPQHLRRVAERIRAPMLAVPERELGAGLIERARTMIRIRQALSDLPFYQAVHLLGTGNPWSIAVLGAAGADSFDGLEWCRVVVDHGSGRLHHYQHFDFFRYQAEYSDSPITQAALGMPDITYPAKVAFHNLDYFQELAAKLRIAAAKGDFEALVVGMLGEANTKQLKREVPGILV